MVYTIFAVILNIMSTVVALLKIPFNFFLIGLEISWNTFKEELNDIWWEEY